MKKRLLASLLALAMVVGLLPAAALATLVPASASDGSGVSTQAAAQGTYDVTFVRDAFDTTEVTVHSVIGAGTGTPLPVPDSSLDGMRLQIGDGTMDANGLAGGYGLLNVEYNSNFYYLTSATWGPSGNGIGTFGYADVETHESDGIYLHYTRADQVPIPVTAVNSMGTETQITQGTIPSGVITEARAQAVVENDTQTWYFDHAELRPRAGGSATGSSPVTIDSIRLENGTYYVTNEEIAQTQAAFDPANWDVYLVYEPGVNLTLNVTLSNGAGQYNTIDGTPVTTLGNNQTSFAVEYQAPRSGARDIEFVMGDGANLDVTETTGNANTSLFSSATDGYQYKSYILSLLGTGSDRTVDVEFFGVSQDKVLDYTTYAANQGNYHGFDLLWNGGSALGTSLNGDGRALQSIGYGSSFSLVLVFGYASSDNAVFVPNRISVNDTWIDIPWPGTDYTVSGPGSNPNSGTHSRSTTIYDSAGNRQATVTASITRWTWLNSRLGSSCHLTLQFTNVTNNLRIDFMNLVNAQNYTETALASIGEGATLHQGTWSNNSSTVSWREMSNGRGWSNSQNITLYAEMDWDYYVDEFRLNGSSGNSAFSHGTNVVGPDNRQSLSQWWGDKGYRFHGTTGTSSQPNNTTRMSGLQRAYLETEAIQFQLRYYMNADGSGNYLTLSSWSTFEDGPIPVTGDIAPNAPEGQVFVGWSLYPSTNSGGRGTILQSGGTLSRGVVDAVHSSVVDYSTTTGQAYIDLYPVFEPATSSEYASYTVIIHRGANDIAGTPVAGSSIAGSLLDRESALALPAVQTVLNSMTGYALDGSKSDTLVELHVGESNTFHLWYNNTNPVTITFVSEHGFEGQQNNEVQVELEPGTLFGDRAPTPVTTGDGVGSFVGWTTTQGSTFVESESLTNNVVPSEATTYYAIYMPDVTLSFYTFNGTTWDSQPTTITLPYGQSLTDMGYQDQVTDLQREVPGYTFEGWHDSGPYGPPKNDLLTDDDFSDNGTSFYAVYTPQSNISITLNANGGTFTGNQGTVQLTNTTYGQRLSTQQGYQQPTRSGGYIFVGWSLDQDDTVGELDPTIAVSSGETYYAIWIAAALDVTVAGDDQVYDGTAKTPTLTVTYNGQNISAGDGTTGYSVEWRNNTNAGVASAIVTYQGRQGFATFEIQPKDIADQSVSTSGVETQYDFTGSTLMPQPTVTDTAIPGTTSGVLALGTDYALSFGANTDVGGGTVAVRGVGNYQGTREIQFQIVAPDGDLTIVPIPDQTYTGSAIELTKGTTLLVYDSNRRLLQDDEYTVQYQNNQEIGQATVIVTGQGNYASKSATGRFQIVAQGGGRLNVVVNPVQMPVGDGVPDIEVTSTATTALGQNYQLSYDRYSEADGSWTTADETMAEAGIYRVTATGTGAFTGTSGTATFVRTALSDENGLRVTLETSSTVLVYDGVDHSSLLSELVVVSPGDGGGDTTLNDGDFTYTVTHNGEAVDNPTGNMVDAGVYTVRVTGNASGDYNGLSGSLTIYIRPRDISNATIAPQQAGGFTVTYTGQAHDHPYTVTDDGLAQGATATTLQADRDYTEAAHNHEAHTGAGTYVVTINGTGNYTGSNSFEFTIEPVRIQVGGTWDGSDMGNVQLEYGYTDTTEALADYLSQAEEQILTVSSQRDDVEIHLYVDSNLQVGQNHPHLHGTLSGADMANYVLDIQSGVDVSAVDLSSAEEGDLVVTVAPTSHEWNGAAHTPTILVTYQNRMLTRNTDYEVSYLLVGESGNTDVTNTGGMVEVGNYIVRITGRGNYSGTAEGNFEVTPPRTGANLVVAIDGADEYTYTGQDIQPQIVVTYGGETLEAGTEYEVIYSGNQNVGQATITVQGRGNTYGNMTGSTTFRINPKDISAAADTTNEITVAPLDGPFVFDGNAHTPVPEITYTPTDGTPVSLTNRTDFFLDYAGNVQAGEATITITGSGNYTGTREVTFQIEYAPVTLSFYTWTEEDGWVRSQTTLEATYGTALTGQESTIANLAPEQAGYTFAGWAEGTPMAGTITSQQLSERDDFNADTTFYAVYRPVSNIQITLNGHGGTVAAIGGQDAGTTVVLQNQTYGEVLRPTATQDGYTFAGWSTSQGAAVGDMSITVGAANEEYFAVWVQPTLEVEVDYPGVSGGGTFTYNGEVQRPDITVTSSEGELSTQDYTVTWSNESSTDAGTYSFVVRTNSGATGFGTYVIAPKDISTVSVSGLGSVTYSGSYQQPLPTVTDSQVPEASRSLQLNRDFTLAYSNNLNAGQATVTIGGIGNYTSTRQESFTIDPYTGTLTVAPVPSQQLGVEGTAVDGLLVVYDSNGNVLDSTDFTTGYEGLNQIGQATVTVTGVSDNYDGASGTGHFQITPLGGGSAGGGFTVTVSPEMSAYDGTDPTVSVRMGDDTLAITQDYTLSYEVYNNGTWTNGGSLTANTIATEMDDAGMYRITATGVNGYTGNSGTAIFVRTAADTSTGGGQDGTQNAFVITGLDAGERVLTYNGTNQNGVLTDLGVNANGSAVGVSDYTVYVSYNNGEEQQGTNIEMINAGVYTIRVQGNAGGNFASSSATATVYIQPQDISNGSIGGLNGHTYGDSVTAPTERTITVTDPEITSGNLAVTQDYTVTGLNAITADTGAGSYLVTVTGTGNFTGTLNAYYTIDPKTISVNTNVNATFGYTTVDLSDLEAEIEAEIENGDNVVINLYVPVGLGVNTHVDAVRGYLSGTDAANYQLALASDVIVSAATINPPDGGDGGEDDPNNVFQMYIYPSTGAFDGESHNDRVYVVVTHNGQLLQSGVDYNLSYAGDNITGDQMVSQGTYTITATGTGDRYNGTISGNYTITSSTGTGGGLDVEINDESGVGGGGTYTYTGRPIQPDVSVTFNGLPLEAGRDYDVSYERNTGVGTAFIHVAGREGTDYADLSGTTTFEIVAKSIGSGSQAADDILISGVLDSYPYNGGSIQPQVTVRDTDRAVDLNRSSEYTVDYGPNVSTQGTVTITGIGNYTGSVTLTFTITADTDLTISGIQNSYTYTGSLIVPEPTVHDGTGRQLTVGTDYIVRYENNLNVGTATVIVEGRGEYSNLEARQTFRIAANLLNLDVTVDPQSLFENDGNTPSISVALDGDTLNEGEYTLTYQVYQQDGTLSAPQELNDPDAQLANVGMYVITAAGVDDHVGALGTATFVRLAQPTGGYEPVIPDPDPDDPDSGDIVIDGENGIITVTFNGQNRVSVLNGITITQEGDSTPVEPDQITISYNGGTPDDVTADVNAYQMVNAGVYTVSYNFISSGNAVVTVVINPKDVNDATVSAVGPGVATYNGAPQRPGQIYLTDSEYSQIAATTDYTVDATVEETDAGTYPVAIRGTGNYTGVRYVNFIINQAPLTVETVGTPTFTYGSVPDTLTATEHYNVSGFQDNDADEVNVTVTAGNLNAGDYQLTPTLSDVSPDNEVAKNYTVTGTVDITVEAISVLPDPDPGDPDPDPNPDKGDEDGDGVVDPDTDTDDDGNIEDVGGPDDEDTPDGVIETVSGFRVEMSPVSQPFNGQPHNPTITVTYQPDENAPGTELQRDTDYTVTYWNSDGEQVTEMIAVGEYTVRVTMTGNYQGGFDLTYTITPGEGGDGGDGDTDNDGNIEDGDGDHEITWGGFHVTMVPYSAVHNGQAHHPRVTVTYMSDGGTATTLQEQQDYNVGYYDSEGNLVPEMIDVGTYTVRVTGVGNYDGFVFELDFTITQQTGGGGIIVPDPEPEGPEVADPDDTGVSDWLDTDNHNAYLQGYGNNLFVPNANMSRAEVAQMFYNLLRNKDVAITVSFDDVPAGSWYAEAVNTLASLGMIKGAGDGRFYPNSPITRAEFIAIAMRFANGGEITGEVSFTDVNPDSWYYESVVGAVQYGWIIGYGNGLFAPNASITRAEVTTIANRMLGRSADEAYVNSHLGELKQFTDVAGWSFYQIVEATNSHTYTMSNGKETWTGLK